MASNRTGGDDTTERSGTETGGYRAVVERYENEPDQCTIFPADEGPERRPSTWITAKSPAFVDLWQHR